MDPTQDPLVISTKQKLVAQESARLESSITGQPQQGPSTAEILGPILGGIEQFVPTPAERAANILEDPQVKAQRFLNFAFPGTVPIIQSFISQQSPETQRIFAASLQPSQAQQLREARISENPLILAENAPLTLVPNTQGQLVVPSKVSDDHDSNDKSKNDKPPKIIKKSPIINQGTKSLLTPRQQQILGMGPQLPAGSSQQILESAMFGKPLMLPSKQPDMPGLKTGLCLENGEFIVKLKLNNRCLF